MTLVGPLRKKDVYMGRKTEERHQESYGTVKFAGKEHSANGRRERGNGQYGRALNLDKG